MKQSHHQFSLLALVLSFVLRAACGDEVSASPPPVLTPEEELETFQFAEPGYRLELVASEPMVQDPVAIQFDGQGRLWVVEMRGYMRDIDATGVNDLIGRVSVLQDEDGDGIMDKSTVFADGLVLPRSVAIHPDGVLIAESKPLWFFEDTDGDLVADKKTLVDPEYAKDNIEHSANGLLRAMDNWIYNAKEGHRYRRSGREWIREDTEKRGQWGICQDDYGRIFYNYNHSQLHADLVPANTLTRNPNHEPSTGLSVGITNTNEVFPIRPNLATNRGYIPGALDENGSIKQFTSACAPLVYRESLFSEFSGNAFVCETAGNLVKRNTLSGSGVRVSGKQAYPDRDFLASTDERFRPTWLSVGPEGALYIADMYRGIVQDSPHMSPYLREHSIARKMEGPIHKGRIWRVVPEGFTQPEAPDFAAKTATELVAYLSHENGWWRDRAQMHLVERNLQEAISELLELARSEEREVARLHALWTLEGLGFSEPEALLLLLKDRSAPIQAATIRVLNSLDLSPSEFLNHIIALTERSPAEEVVLQLILTLGDLEIDETARFRAMAKLVLPRASDPLIRDAALSSLSEREVDFLKMIWETLPDSVRPQSGEAFLVEALALSSVRSRDSEKIGGLMDLLGDKEHGWKERAVLTGIGIFGPSLINEPVSLTSAPVVAETEGIVKSYFAWPGHVPVTPESNKVRPLKKNERALFARGRQVYLTSCVACHGSDGKGMKLLAPPLAGSDWVMGRKERLARVLFHGLSGPITVSGKRYEAPEVQPVMPPLATLGNNEIAAVLTYIRREWGNTADPITSGEVNKLRIAAQGRTTPWTEEELEPFAKGVTALVE